MAVEAAKAVLADTAQRYAASAIPALEAAVEAQVADGSYAFEVNLALLNLYQLHPQQAKEEMVTNVLAKALTALPNPDYQLCKSVTSKAIAASASVQWLDGLSRQLEMGEFQAFWRDAGGGGDAKPAFDVLALTGLASAVRSFIMGLVNVTYQKISAAALGEMLQLEGAELDAQISASQYERDGDLLVVPLCAENQEKPKSAKENFGFQELAPVYELCTAQAQ